MAAPARRLAGPRDVGEALERITSQMQVNDSSSHISEGVQVAERLGSAQETEREALSRDRHVAGRIRGQDHRYDMVRAALVELARRVEVARPERRGDGNAQAL